MYVLGMPSAILFKHKRKSRLGSILTLTGNLPVRQRVTLRRSKLLTGILPVSASFFHFFKKKNVKNRSLTGKLPVSKKTSIRYFDP